MNWSTKRFFVACALVLALALCSFSPVLADDTVDYGATNNPPDPSTLQPAPPETPRDKAITAMKEKTAAAVAQLTGLKKQNRITEKEWMAGVLTIREEVDAFRREVGLPLGASTTNKLNSESLAAMTATLDWLNGMHFVDQTANCKNGCGVASAKEVLDYEHVAYGSPSYSFDQVRQHLGLTCCSGTPEECRNAQGVCLGNANPSIEHTLETLGTATYEVHASSSESGWFNDLVTSVSGWRYPQVMLTRPNFDGTGGISLYNWHDQPSTSHHYNVVSGYNSTDQNVWYQESAYWTPGDFWWPANTVWQVNNNADATKGCAPPYKLIW